MTAAPLRVAVLVKQVPAFEAMELGPDGRLKREGLELEMNPYCRRAVSKGTELALDSDGESVVFTLGPPAAEDTLREAIAWGIDEGVLVTDAAFAGSDTLATARALAAVLRREGPFDLVLVGRNSVDADTGQVGPELAELLDLPFVGGAKELAVGDGQLKARCEYDDGYAEVVVALPAVVSTAERLCEPAKIEPAGRAAVPASRIRRLTAGDLGEGPWGTAGSPTRVGEVRVLEVTRERRVLDGPIERQVDEAVELLRARGVLDPHVHDHGDGTVPAAGAGEGGPVVAVVLEPDRDNVARELLGAAAALASDIGGRVVAIGPEPLAAQALSSWGADRGVSLSGAAVEEDVSGALAGWAEASSPWAVLVPGTVWGREVAARAAARLGAGLTGDAVALEAADGRLVAWKPAFGGQLVAAVTAVSAIQMATVRPGVLHPPMPRPAVDLPLTHVTVEPRHRVVVTGYGRDDDIDALAAATRVVGVGTGVPPAEYGTIEPLLHVLGAELAATRKVTDKAWLPRARQVGITGRSIRPRLYVALGLSGKFNHMVGVRAAHTVLAVNSNADALVFSAADVGIVGDWREAVPLLTARFGAALG